MKRHILAFAILAVLAATTVASGTASADNDPLFSNVTTAEPHRAKMALMFTRRQQDLKHPVTVFLNDQGVLVGSKAKAADFAEHQALLASIIKDGGNVVVCQMCMEHYGVAQTDLIDGAQISNPELTGKLLFEDDTQTLSW